MADTTFDVSLKFLAGPYGQVALGISLGVGVSKLFKAIGDVLNDKTNKKTLVGLKCEMWTPPLWPKMRSVGQKHLQRSLIGSW